MLVRIAMLQPSSSGHHAPPPDGADILRRRIVAEFHEMPGLVLSIGQASRLLGLAPDTCEQILAQLAADGVLRKRATGSYGCA
jgi:hypothetical protein